MKYANRFLAFLRLNTKKAKKIIKNDWSIGYFEGVEKQFAEMGRVENKIEQYKIGNFNISWTYNPHCYDYKLYINDLPIGEIHYHDFDNSYSINNKEVVNCTLEEAKKKLIDWAIEQIKSVKQPPKSENDYKREELHNKIIACEESINLLNNSNARLEFRPKVSEEDIKRDFIKTEFYGRYSNEIMNRVATDGVNNLKAQIIAEYEKEIESLTKELEEL